MVADKIAPFTKKKVVEALGTEVRPFWHAVLTYCLDSICETVAHPESLAAPLCRTTTWWKRAWITLRLTNLLKA